GSGIDVYSTTMRASRRKPDVAVFGQESATSGLRLDARLRGPCQCSVLLPESPRRQVYSNGGLLSQAHGVGPQPQDRERLPPPADAAAHPRLAILGGRRGGRDARTPRRLPAHYR